MHLICGFLGVGKTTALRALAARRPSGERWAILVNEVGMIDVDGAVLEASRASAMGERQMLPLQMKMTCFSALMFPVCDCLREVSCDILLYPAAG